jgi:hypothetical protein
MARDLGQPAPGRAALRGRRRQAAPSASQSARSRRPNPRSARVVGLPAESEPILDDAGSGDAHQGWPHAAPIAVESALDPASVVWPRRRSNTHPALGVARTRPMHVHRQTNQIDLRRTSPVYSAGPTRGQSPRRRVNGDPGRPTRIHKNGAARGRTPSTRNSREAPDVMFSRRPLAQARRSPACPS